MTSSAQKEIIKSKISAGTVFLSGAEIIRKGAVSLKKGNSDIIFESLPLDIAEESITAGGKGAFTILSVSRKIVAENTEQNKRIEELNKKIKTIDKSIDDDKNLIMVFQTEEQFLTANFNMKGDDGITAAMLKEMADFYRTRLKEIKSEISKLNIHIKELTEERKLIAGQCHYVPPQKSEITLSVTADADTAAEIELSYYIKSAGWTPVYDIRVNKTDEPVMLYYKASVWQSSGEDWDNIKLSLSTGNPVLSGTQPILEPYWLNFIRPRGSFKSMARSLNQVSAIDECNIEEEMDYDMAAPAAQVYASAPAAAPVTAIKENQTNIEFEIEAHYNILSGAGEKSVEIKTAKVEAEYQYYCARKLDKAVFLLAKLKDWASLNLLEAAANIFYEGKFVCTSHINPHLADKFIEISLGRDSNVIVTRLSGKDFSQKSFGNIKASREWTLTARNLKQQTIKLQLVDQFPVSNDKSITVDAINTGDGEYNKDRGILTFNIELKPAEQKTYNLKYQVTYPAERIINLE